MDEHDVDDLRDTADDIEIIDFDGAARPPKRRHGAVFTGIAAALATLLVVALAGGGWYLWTYKWRNVTISVDNEPVTTSADTTIAELLKDHDDFGRKPGRLLSVKGSILKKDGGLPVSVKLDGQPLATADYATTTIARAATMTVTPGVDVVEPHDVEQRKVPFPTDINLNNGPIQVVTQQGVDGVNEVWIGKQSKQENVHRTVSKPVPLVVQSFSPTATDGRKVIALTFDDGPSQYTGRILDVLRQKKVKATFFDLGEQALAYPQLEQRMVAEGHQVASHSVSHPYLPDLDGEELRQEIVASFEDLEKASDTKTRILRAPYGAFGAEQWKEAATVMDMNVLWTIDTLDWKRPGAKAIRQEVSKNAYNGAVALMHDGGGDRTQTIEALPGIIDDLRKQGYEFVTIDQLCELGGVPKAAQAGSSSLL
ncbi:polysaccharide deacetylase family protein [Bifidobacterium cuniculi]|uniref:Polysaccharide deacetylase n=1 Tax=Bifidobacterium cuniculi TaxID=1688 RepID=A0A087APQ4_9BIFI|nr:polysaccharide deacetylase family protein [Bifidobacterium cuniculi]KFI60754.1 polysaccharide deacetylase [Bifidobacterium cuniculi]